MTQDKKEQILIAANECFAKFGYKKTTLTDIGKKIGLNKVSLYHYFKSKEHIFTTIVMNEFQQFIDQLHKRIEETMNCERKILVYFEEKLHFWVEKAIILPQITEIPLDQLEQLMATGLEIHSKIELEEQTFVADILRQCIEKNQIKECNIHKISAFIFSLVEGVKTNWSATHRNNPSTNADDSMLSDVRAALKIFLQGLK